MAEGLVIETMIGIMIGTGIMIRVKMFIEMVLMIPCTDETMKSSIERPRELIGKMGGSKDKQEEESNENLDREYDKQEGYQENIAVQLAELEKGDFERIKEESWRRRQAVLEKYKSKQQKPLITLQSIGEWTRLEILQRKWNLLKSFQKKSDNQVEGAGDHVPKLSVVVEKSPSQNGLPLLRFLLKLVG